MDINSLVRRAIKGDRGAYGEIYRHFQSKIYRFVYFQVYEREEAVDLTQETFLRVWKAMPEFHTESGTFQSYLYRVAKNLVIDNFRKKRDISLSQIPEMEIRAEFEDEIDRQLNAKMVISVLNHLSGDEKQIVILRYFEELPFADISRIMDINEGTLRVRIHRILEKLKNCLNKA